MGFRSTFITQDYRVKLPDWFVDKWREHMNFGEDSSFPLSSKYEGKLYGKFAGLEKDIQAAVDWEVFRLGHIILVWLHECDGITWVKIERDCITFMEPPSMVQVEEPTCPNVCEGSRHRIAVAQGGLSIAD